ncbi:MAG TPA: lipopolysaccharide kinase InaA family protein [Thermoanaerobaculia bacterium]|nr:lipopolysaccharide kinase InaA family protein [Thermoanaerobaculia bacterium]
MSSPAYHKVEPGRFVRLRFGDLHTLCREDLLEPVTRAYQTDRWVYDALERDPDAVRMRGRRPVIAGKLDQVPVVVKRMHHGGLLAPLRRDGFLTASRVRAHLFLAEYLTLRGVLTAPVAFASWRRVRGFVRCEVGFERIEEGIDADCYFFRRPLVAGEWEARAEDIGALVARLHRAGFLHADLNVMNFLFTPQNQTYILDLDKTAIPSGPLSNRQKERNLQRLERSIQKQGRDHLAAFVESIIARVRAGYRTAIVLLHAVIGHELLVSSQWLSGGSPLL